MHKFADRLQNVEEYYFSKKLEQIQQMRNKGINVINLGIGNPDMPPPKAAIDTAVKWIEKDQSHGYTSYRSSPELRMAMSQWYGQSYHINLDAERDVLPLLGSKEGILYLSMAMLNPGDSVLIPNPGYPAYASIANLLGVEIIYYDLTEANHWLPDFSKIKMFQLNKCKLMWVNYPNMPTGKFCDVNFFKKLIDFAKNTNILVCNDNPYGMVLNSTNPISIFAADPEKQYSCELNSLSKSFNMAGWRVGLLAASSEVINAVLRVKSNVDSGMFLPIQKGAAAALATSTPWHEERNHVYEKRRKIIWQIFDSLKFSYAKDQVGLFVWAKAPSTINNVAEYLDHILDQAHVFLTPGFIFGSNGLNYARASLCNDEEILLMALDRVRNYVK